MQHAVRDGELGYNEEIPRVDSGCDLRKLADCSRESGYM